MYIETNRTRPRPESIQSMEKGVVDEAKEPHPSNPFIDLSNNTGTGRRPKKEEKKKEKIH